MNSGSSDAEKRRLMLHCAALNLTVEFSLRPGEFARIGASPEMEISLPITGIQEEECRISCDEEGVLWLAFPGGGTVRAPEGFVAGQRYFTIKGESVQRAAPPPVPPPVPRLVSQPAPPPLPQPLVPAVPDESVKPEPRELLPEVPGEIPPGYTPPRAAGGSFVSRPRKQALVNAAIALIASGVTIWFLFMRRPGSAEDPLPPLPPPSHAGVAVPAWHGDGAVKEAVDGELNSELEERCAEIAETVVSCRRMEADLAEIIEATDYASIRVEASAVQRLWKNSLYSGALDAGERLIRKAAVAVPASAQAAEGVRQLDTMRGKKPGAAGPARDFLELVKNRAAGVFEKPMMRGHLLWLYPDFMQAPEKEFKAGHVFHDSISGPQNRAVKVSVPLSWRLLPAAKDSTVRNFEPRYGYQLAGCMVTVSPLEMQPGKTMKVSEWEEAFTRGVLEKNLASQGCTLTSFESDTIRGCAVRRFSFLKSTPGSGRKTVHRAVRASRIVTDGCLVEINLNADSKFSMDRATEDAEQLARVFKLVEGSVEIIEAGRPSAAPAAARDAPEDKRSDSDLFSEVKAEAEKGDAAAQFATGQAYYQGIGVTKNETEAGKWFLKAAEQGHPESQMAASGLYFKGLGLPKDLKAALRWALKAAEKLDNGVLFCSIGDIYMAMLAPGGSAATAMKWYRKASGKNDARSEFIMGLIYKTGNGVPADAVEGTKWLRLAAEHGLVKAQSRLGFCYHSGDGAKKDPFLAYAWRSAAAKNGDKESAEWCARFRVEHSSVEIIQAEKKAKEILARLAQSEAKGNSLPREK